MSAFSQSALLPDSRLPRLIRPGAERDLAAFIAAHRAAVEECLLEHGALLFRGFDVASVEHVERVGAQPSAETLGYMYRSAPRSTAGQGVFSTTERPPDQDIVLDCENAY